MVDGYLAKHGYTVEWGFFSGTCMGSGCKPLELEKTLTEAIIVDLREKVAPAADKLAADLEAGAVEPKWMKTVKLTERRFGPTKKVECERAELQSWQQAEQLKAAIYRALGDARGARSHADMLEQMIEMRHGKELTPVTREERKQLKVGSRVLIGGKKGDICEVVKLEDKVCSGCGPYMNGKLMLHAFFKAEDGRLWAIPARSIRQSAIQ
jgi:hypothetical protein